jgi:hypothetical protein
MAKETKVETKRARVITTVIDGEVMTFNVTGAGSFTVNAAALSADIRAAAMMHGLKQKIADAAAMSLNDDGLPAAPADKMAAMQDVADALIAGDWSQRSSGDGSAPVSGIIYRAFHQFLVNAATAQKLPIPDDMAAKTRAIYDAKTRAEQLALRREPAIAAIMAELRPAPKTSSVDTGAMLSALGIG